MDRTLVPGCLVITDIQKTHAWVSEAVENLNYCLATVIEIKEDPNKNTIWYREFYDTQVLVEFKDRKKVNNITMTRRFHFKVEDLVVLPRPA